METHVPHPSTIHPCLGRGMRLMYPVLSSETLLCYLPTSLLRLKPIHITSPVNKSDLLVLIPSACSSCSAQGDL